VPGSGSCPAHFRPALAAWQLRTQLLSSSQLAEIDSTTSCSGRGPLAGVGLRAVSIDLPGQYQSSGPDDPAVYTTTWFGSVVREVARRLQCEDAAERGIAEPTTLLGHSFGGLVCRAAVIDEPALFDSLTLLCSSWQARRGEGTDN